MIEAVASIAPVKSCTPKTSAAPSGDLQAARPAIKAARKEGARSGLVEETLPAISADLIDGAPSIVAAEILPSTAEGAGGTGASSIVAAPIPCVAPEAPAAKTKAPLFACPALTARYAAASLMLLKGPPLLKVKLVGGVGVLEDVPKMPETNTSSIDPSIDAVTAEGVIEYVFRSLLLVAAIVSTLFTARNAEYKTPILSRDEVPVVVQVKVLLAPESPETTLSFRNTRRYWVSPPPEKVADAEACSVQPEGGVTGVFRA